MNQDPMDQAGRRRTRLFLVIFLGIALLLAAMTIIGTWSRLAEGSVAPASVEGQP